MSQRQREQAGIGGQLQGCTGSTRGVNGSKRGRFASTITLARPATQKEALNTRSYNEEKKLVCKFCRQYAVNNSAQKGARRCPARSNAPAASNLLGTMRGNSNRGHT